MKKFFAYLLLLAMCVTLFAGCQSEADPGLESAKTYLYNMYKDTNGSTTNASYDVVGVVVIQGVGTYNVEWTVDNSNVTVTPNGKMVAIGIPEYPEADFTYKLTGTLKDANNNTASVTFEYNVPKALGQPATLADGTYVIANGNLTMSSLAEDKGYGYPTANEVTIADGAVTGHKKADVLTIKNVEGGVTIQDAYGRYFHLKGDYNSFNVSAEAPEEGHIFTVLSDGTNYYILNSMNKKTLAYSSSYSSWGCYPKLDEDHNPALTIVAATAPAEDPENKPDDQPATPSGAQLPPVTAPAAGTTYKFGMIQVTNGKTIYIAGGIDQDRYLKVTTEWSKALDVNVETSGDGIKISTTIDGQKVYITLGTNDAGKTALSYTADGTVFKFNSELSCWYASLDGTDYYMGTYSTFDTVSASKTSYISKDNAGVSQFPAGFFETEPAGGNDEKPSTGDSVTVDTSAKAPFADGDKIVIYNPNYKMAFSTQPAESNSYYQKGIQITVSGDAVSGHGDTEIWTVSVNSDGTYSFSQGGKKIAMQDSYGSMSLGSVNDKWELVGLSNGCFMLKNAKRGNYMQWSTQYGNWSTYNPDAPESDNQYHLAFYVVK